MSTQGRSVRSTWQVIGGAAGVFLLAFAWLVLGFLPTGAFLLLALTALVAGTGIFLLGLACWQMLTGLRHRMEPHEARPGLTPMLSRADAMSGEPDPRQEAARTLELDPNEATLLGQIITRYLGDIGMEIAGTDSYAMREDLKRDRAAARRLLTRLRTADGSAQEAIAAAVVEMRALAEAGA